MPAAGQAGPPPPRGVYSKPTLTGWRRRRPGGLLDELSLNEDDDEESEADAGADRRPVEIVYRNTVQPP